jgi:hypothetical protein
VVGDFNGDRRPDLADTTLGILRFDADGSGIGVSSIIATLSTKPALSSSNFQVF